MSIIIYFLLVMNICCDKGFPFFDAALLLKRGEEDFMYGSQHASKIHFQTITTHNFNHNNSNQPENCGSSFSILPKNIACRIKNIDFESIFNAEKIQFTSKSMIPASGKTIPASGKTVFPEAGIIFPEVGTILPKKKIDFPKVGMTFSEVGIAPPEGGIVFFEGGNVFTEGGMPLPEGGIVYTEGGMALPEGGLVYPEGGMALLEVGIVLPEALPLLPVVGRIDVDVAIVLRG
ncbi:MAG: hypothetical protein WCH34_13290, partial [Bacteroidota bacterium]